MNELRELIGIVNKNKLKAVAPVTLKAFVPGPLALKLYDLVAESKVATDAEAISALFPERRRLPPKITNGQKMRFGTT